MQRRKETKAKEASAKRATILNAARLSRAALCPPSRKYLNFYDYCYSLRSFLGQGKNTMLYISDEYFVNCAKQRSEAKFIKAFVAKFVKPHRTTVFLGDWSHGAARFHAPCKTKGFRTMFERANFDVFLVEEYRTSSVCPDCQRRNLKPFKKRRSPRPWRGHTRALVHGLLR